MKKFLLIFLITGVIFTTGCIDNSLKPIETAVTTTLEIVSDVSETATETSETVKEFESGAEVFSTNFENGTADGFKVRGSNSVKGEVTKEDSNSGSYSFKVSGRTMGWNGATIDVTRIFSKIESYSFEVRMWVKLPKDSEPCTMRLSAQVNLGTKETYDYLSGDEASKFISPSDGWVELVGYGIWTKSTYDILNIYVETSSEGAKNEFYVDDIKIVED